MNSNHYCVIMAGGVGSRFWPQSTEATPKQFLDVLGSGQTLIQQTFARFNALVPAENILVVTNSKYVELVAEQLPRMLRENILAEPMMRNTAPCLAYAVMKIESKNPNAIMAVTPADHLISKTEMFNRVMQIGLNHVATNSDIVTIGIEPNRPNTGYGYIEYSKTIGTLENEPVEVLQFREKPNLETAQKYLEQGNFSWNSGMFLWSIPTIKSSFEKHAPEVINHFKTEGEVYNTNKERSFIDEVFPKCPSISIDYAILEKASNVKVINTDIGWSDIGTWVSLEEHIQKSQGINAVISGKVLLEDSENNIVSLESGRILVTKGLNNMIIVEKDGVLMIVAKDYEQDIKELRANAGNKFGNKII